jgi:uncharacterized protein (TIGR02599 family)
MTSSTPRQVHAFTLVELLVSMVVLSIIMFVSASFVSQMQKTWTQSSARVEQFREARMAFETVTQSLRQATLNPYLTYRYNSGPTPTVPASNVEAPLAYLRHSELQFVCGPVSDLLATSSGGTPVTHAVFFQAPMGITERDGYEALNRLLCGRGYFIMESDDTPFRPAHVTKVRSRFRLWEYRPPAERNTVYASGEGEWFKDAAAQVVTSSETAALPSYSRPVAENILALVISPRVTKADADLTGRQPTWIAPAYAYDSQNTDGASSSNPQGTQHLLPPMLQVTLVAVDEASAARLAEEGASATLVPTGAFKSYSAFESDMAALETALIALKANYRVFSTTVALRNSKWNLIPQ